MASVLVRNSKAAPSAKSMRPVTSPKATVESGGTSAVAIATPTITPDSLRMIA